MSRCDVPKGGTETRGDGASLQLLLPAAPPGAAAAAGPPRRFALLRAGGGGRARLGPGVEPRNPLPGVKSVKQRRLFLGS